MVETATQKIYLCLCACTQIMLWLTKGVGLYFGNTLSTPVENVKETWVGIQTESFLFDGQCKISA